ncbi:MAG: virulence RhuM family protein [Ruminococcus sp.]|nr:virulence RhuM family protein [Ruminococcus sp.]
MNDKNKEMRMVLYHAQDDDVSVNALIENETLWVTQKAMAELFDVDRSVITKHLSNIYSDNELSKEATCAKIAQVQNEGGRSVTRKVEYYSLDAIISVGYRVNSKKATAFRIWATNVLKEYMQKGFVMDDERLKQGEAVFGKDYFRELLERVRSIRASERRIWQQITDIFAECSIDYDKDSDVTARFYATVQNKFHYAITGQTAAEIVYNTADHTKDNMGLTTWKNAPDGRILRSDTYVAKNYLDEKQIRQLERSVSGYFDYIEGLIERENTFTMAEFAESVNAFLSFNRYDILKDNGKVSHIEANKKASTEYDIFNKTQKIESDFDRAVKNMLSSNDTE